MENRRCHNAEIPPQQDVVDPDERLLDRFVANGDEAAFATLVERHAALVLGVCRRVLANGHDAEEAFQATFLVLVQKAPRVRVERTLGPWLYGVAYRIALRAAHKKARRREQACSTELLVSDNVLQEVADHYNRQVLDDELNALPAKYREPLVLRYLAGKSNRQVAAELRITVRTVEGRQRRGKHLLRRRLALRKVNLPLAAAAVAATRQAVEASTLEPLLGATLEAVRTTGTGGASYNGASESYQLAKTEAMTMSNFLSLATVGVGALVLTAVGLGVWNEFGAESRGGGSPGTLLLLAAMAADSDPFGGSPPTAGTSTGRSPAHDNPFGIDPQPTSAAEQPDGATTTETPFAGKPDAQVVALHQWPINERRIYATLREELRSPIEFIERPLSEAMDEISADYEIPIILDVTALESVAISPDIEVTTEPLRGISLRSALNLVLAGAEDLTYVIDNEVLMITTTDEAESMLDTRIYDIRGFAASVSGVEELAATLVKKIPSVVACNSWSANNMGEGSIETIGGALVVTQTQRVHEEIVDFLEQLTRYVERGQLSITKDQSDRSDRTDLIKKEPTGGGGGGLY